jgi:hypothetical protein
MEQRIQIENEYHAEHAYRKANPTKLPHPTVPFFEGAMLMLVPSRPRHRPTIFEKLNWRNVNPKTARAACRMIWTCVVGALVVGLSRPSFTKALITRVKLRTLALMKHLTPSSGNLGI